ncbi:MAG: RNB domain-containing ribonuclease, partial [Treponema sp.]|nr:RNB domain-containing ribonuclease [Treponema sp.]
GVTPSVHGGLGLSVYSQVTSPLRRYGDLISHQQLRAFLKKEKMIDKDEMLIRMSAGEAAAQAAKKAERNSRMHWTLVYLLQNPDLEFEAVCIDKSKDIPQFFIPSIGMEIQLKHECELNDVVKVKVSKIDLPTLSSVFQTV